MTVTELKVEPIILVAEFYESGGTRTYLKQLLEFFSLIGASVVLVGVDETVDREMQSLLDQYSFRYVSYQSVMSASSGGTKEIRIPKTWSRGTQRREKRAFSSFVKSEGARGILVTAGTPGQFAGASTACSKSLYILHTYPHGRRQHLLSWAYMKPVFSRTPHFLAVSEFQKRQMELLWGLSSRSSDITVIPNTAGPAISKSDAPAALPLRVLTASWVEAYKGPFFWIDVAEKVVQRYKQGQVQFRWIGEGSLLNQARSMAEGRGLGSTVEFAGHVDEVGDEFDDAAVYLQPSFTENMSLSVIEALRSGVPSVVSRVGGLVEIIQDSESGFFFESGDVDGAAAALVSLLDSQVLREDFGEAARQHYASNFDQDLWNDAMKKIHNDIFGEVNPL